MVETTLVMSCVDLDLGDPPAAGSGGPVLELPIASHIYVADLTLPLHIVGQPVNTPEISMEF